MRPVTAAALRVHRAGTGEPLVLLHGLGTSAHAWAPVLEPLARRHDVLACDLPGFGGSPPPPAGAPPTPEALADAVEAALDDLGVPAAHLCGNSLGGWVALELARRGRARSVVAISPAGFWSEPERRYALASLRVAHRQARLLAPVAPAAMALPPVRFAFLAQVRRRPRRVSRREAAREVGIVASPAFARTREVTLDGRRPQRLEEIAAPALVLWGTADLLLPVRQAREAAAALPRAQVERLPGLGHMPMADDPRAVAEAVLAFTARSSAR